MGIRIGQNCFGGEWKSFVDENSRAMFQTALLLCLDPQRAEDALINSVADFDLSRPPRSDDCLIWERAVVKLSLETSLLFSTDEFASLASPLIQRGLRPLTQIKHLPRISFVLRLLLGYTAETCAQILGIQESEIAPLTGEAAAQLSNQLTPCSANGFTAHEGRLGRRPQH
jgi:hypothetical protein